LKNQKTTNNRLEKITFNVNEEISKVHENFTGIHKLCLIRNYLIEEMSKYQWKDFELPDVLPKCE